MDNSVVIKGNKNGITLLLDPKLDFETLKEKIAVKFRDSARIWGDHKVAIAFQGRDLTDAEQVEVLDVIGQNSSLDVICVLSDDDTQSKNFTEAIDETLMDRSGNSAVFYKGIIRGGEIVEKDKSIIVLGDVNPNANIISEGNIVILGSLKGTACAGSSGNHNAFIFALDMQPSQLRIADTIARSADASEGKTGSTGPMLAYLDHENICIEPVSKKAIGNINLRPGIV
ncbi:MAG: septum site-determining protein MinC [Lachnospiraceae bacterium]|nr:septum site-determining protein MinC [Lachnospiraceae bacterium]